MARCGGIGRCDLSGRLGFGLFILDVFLFLSSRRSQALRDQLIIWKVNFMGFVLPPSAQPQ